MGNMWRLSLRGVQELNDDPEYGVSWETVQMKGSVPGKISHHKTAVFGQTVMIYGGINDHECCVFEFDSMKNNFTQLKQTGDVPKLRDDHSMSQIDEEQIIIFGGFVEGSRCNECFVGKKNGANLEWRQVGAKSPQAPCPRNSHTSVFFEGKLYIFGGQDDETNKLCDLWEFDCATEVFKQIDLPEGSYMPSARSGHSANIYNGKMYIFGGILELTKELNELISFDFKTRQFKCCDSAQGIEENFQMSSNLRANDADMSPGIRKEGQPGSPTKVGRRGGFSPTKSPSKTMKAKLRGKSPSKKDEGGVSKKESTLSSPTSISMQSTFIIKNADESFDAYYAQMKKRKQYGGHDNTGHSATLQGQSPGLNGESNFGVVSGIQPAARDGHTTEVNSDGLMFMFGGDRHHMPFNDLHLMKL